MIGKNIVSEEKRRKYERYKRRKTMRIQNLQISPNMVTDNFRIEFNFANLQVKSSLNIQFLFWAKDMSLTLN
jgi:hypothetical protein